MGDEADFSMKHVQVRVTAVEHQRLQELAGGSGRMQSFIRSLMQSAISERTKQRYDSKHTHWHDLLDQILTRGTDRQKLGIQSNLEAFVGNLPAAPRVEEEEIVYRPKSAKRRAS